MEEEKKEKLDFLKRVEVRTMQKDIASAREKDAKKEAERLTDLDVKNKLEKEVAEKGMGEQTKSLEEIIKKQEEKEIREKEDFLKSVVEEGREEDRERTEFVKKPENPEEKTRETGAEGTEEKKREELLRRLIEERNEKIKAEEIEKTTETEKEKSIEEEKEKNIFKGDERSALKEKKAELEEEIKSLSSERQPLDDKKSQIFSEIEKIRSGLAPILGREAEAEKKKMEIDVLERKTTLPEKRREIEKQRWVAETERENIETERWEKEGEIEGLETKLRDIDSEYQEIVKKEKELKKELEKISKREGAIGLEEEKKKLESEIFELTKEEEPLKIEKGKLSMALNQMKTDFDEIREIESGIEDEVKISEEKERMAKTPQDKKEIEQKRWQLETKRKDFENKRWEKSSEKDKLYAQLKDLDAEYQTLAQKETQLRVQLKTIQQKLGQLPQKPLENIEVIRKIKEAKTPETPEKIRENFIPQKTEEEILKERRMEVVEKLRKDLEDVQETENLERKDFLERIEPEKKETPVPAPEIIQKPVFQKPPSQRPIAQELPVEDFPTQEIKPAEIFGEIPRKPSIFEKLFVRLLVLIIFAAIILSIVAFWYWNAKIKKAPQPVQAPNQQEQQNQEPEENIPVEPEPEPELLPPSSLILIGETRTAEIATTGEIPFTFSQVFSETLKEDAFTRILFKNTEESRWLSLEEILSSFNINVPENFYQKTEDYTFFIYSQKEGKRIGFMAKIKEGESLSLENSLKIWEASAEKDTENLFILMGKEKPALVPYFKNGEYNGFNFRYQTISKNDLGAVYSIINENNFVFTSSWLSMSKIIDQLSTI